MNISRLRLAIEKCCVEAMDTMDGNKVQAAKYLGITRTTLKKYLKSFHRRKLQERRKERRRVALGKRRNDNRHPSAPAP